LLSWRPCLVDRGSTDVKPVSGVRIVLEAPVPHHLYYGPGITIGLGNVLSTSCTGIGYTLTPCNLFPAKLHTPTQSIGHSLVTQIGSPFLFIYPLRLYVLFSEGSSVSTDAAAQ